MIQKKWCRTLFGLFVLLNILILGSGCASLCKTFPTSIDQRPTDSLHFFEAIDRIVNESGSGNASWSRVACFPYLRTNRFLSALVPDADSIEKTRFLVDRMRQMDLSAREKELECIPQKQREEFSNRFGIPKNVSGIMAEITNHSKILMEHDIKQPGFISALSKAARVPDEYRTWMRVFGLYPLTSVITSFFIESSYRKYTQVHEKSTDNLEGTTQFIPRNTLPYSRKSVSEIIHESSKNPWRIPLPDDEQKKRLLNMFAPAVLLESEKPLEFFGRVFRNGGKTEVDTRKPIVYYYFSHAFFQGDPCLQINYTIWFRERSGPQAPWIERGPLDGMTIRINLDASGIPFMIDIMNNCGCYHMFAPDSDRLIKIRKKPMSMDLLIPAKIPEGFPEKPCRIRINEGWHQVTRIDTLSNHDRNIPYELFPYEKLEALPVKNGNRISESIFDSRGIAKNSERIEPWIFFSMGIPEVGSMRQRGHHATTLVGRQHFDNPELFDENFLFQDENDKNESGATINGQN